MIDSSSGRTQGNSEMLRGISQKPTPVPVKHPIRHTAHSSRKEDREDNGDDTENNTSTP